MGPSIAQPGRPMAHIKKIKPPHVADTRGGRWVGIPHCVMESEAYRDLSLFARAVLGELVRVFDGCNNGKIAISQREIAHRLKNSNYRKISIAYADLQSHGFIEIEFDGEWATTLAREVRLTFISSGSYRNPIPATNDYLHFQKKCADDVSADRDDYADASSSTAKKSADDVSARILAHRRKSAKV